MTLKDNKEHFGFAQSIIAFFWCFIIVLFSGSPYQTIFNLSLPLLFLGALCLIPLLLISLNKNKLYLNDIVFILLLLMVFFTIVIHFEFEKQFYWRFVSVLLITFYISQRYSFKQISNFYIQFMFLIAIFSLIGYFLLNNTRLLNLLPKVMNINDVQYGIGIFFNYITEIPKRNCGIFWEPGIYASYLIIAIAFEIMNSSSKYILLHTVVFVTALFTANSSAGFLLFFVCLLLFAFSKIRGKRFGFISNLFSITFLVTSIFMLLNLDIIIMKTSLAYNEYFVKLMSSNLESSARITVISHNLKIFFGNFLFGAGVEKVSQNIIQYADISTLTYILSIFGIPGFLLLFGIIIGVGQQKNINLYQKITFISILITILSKEPHLEMLFIWILFFAMLKDKNSLGKRRFQT